MPSHRSNSFALSSDPSDPRFIEKVRDIVRLHPDPSGHALLLYVNERSQVQARERTQPIRVDGTG